MRHDTIEHWLRVILTSDKVGKIEAAARRAKKLLEAEGLDGHDVATAFEQRGKFVKLLEAAKTFKTERDQLQIEVDRLKQRQQPVNGNGTLAQALWQPVGMPLNVENRHAVWVLNLVVQGRHHLMDRESDFLTSCASRRRLSEAQRNWLQDIVRKAINRTGETPPP